MAKAKKISVNAFERAAKESSVPYVSIDWHGNNLQIKHTLAFEEMMTFVDLCTDTCFTSDDGKYMPEKLPFAIKHCMVTMYTNVATPEKTERQYELIYGSDLIDTIMEHINITQFNEICSAINSRVKYRTQVNIEAVNRRIEGIYATIENLERQFASSFDGITSDDLKAIVGAMSNDGVDEDKLVKAYLKQKKAK